MQFPEKYYNDIQSIKAFALEEEPEYPEWMYCVQDDEEYPPVDMTYTFEIVGDPYVIWNGVEFDVNVHVKFGSDVAPGEYCAAMEFYAGGEDFFYHGFIVP